MPSCAFSFMASSFTLISFSSLSQNITCEGIESIAFESLDCIISLFFLSVTSITTVIMCPLFEAVSRMLYHSPSSDSNSSSRESFSFLAFSLKENLFSIFSLLWMLSGILATSSQVFLKFIPKAGLTRRFFSKISP